MATVRFSMVEIASRALGVEALARIMAEVFGQKSAVKTSRFERQREAIWKREMKKLQHESRSLCEWTANHIIPQAGNYHSSLIDEAKHAFTVYSPEEVEKLSMEMSSRLEKLTAQVAIIRMNLDKMNEASQKADELTDERSVIQAYYRNVIPCMEAVRESTQKLSMIIA